MIIVIVIVILMLVVNQKQYSIATILNGRGKKIVCLFLPPLPLPFRPLRPRPRRPLPLALKTRRRTGTFAFLSITVLEKVCTSPALPARFIDASPELKAPQRPLIGRFGNTPVAYFAACLL